VAQPRYVKRPPTHLALLKFCALMMAGYDFARKDEYTQLSDGRRLRFIRSPNSDCLDKYGEGTDLLLTERARCSED
jgi:hypothetical protein